MGVLKTIGYLVAAVAVLTVLVFGGTFIIVMGFLVGCVLSLIGSTIFTASSLKSFFESKDKHSGTDSK